ncbi:MAG: succinate dehydrogenase assembly factor 2 [Alphaproteobacteria bacterium]
MDDDTLDDRRKRMFYQAAHRGMIETDLLLGRFAKVYLPRFTNAQLDTFDVLLELPDNDIINWRLGRVPVPPEYDTDVMRLLMDFDLVGDMDGLS